MATSVEYGAAPSPAQSCGDTAPGGAAGSDADVPGPEAQGEPCQRACRARMQSCGAQADGAPGSGTSISTDDGTGPNDVGTSTHGGQARNGGERPQRASGHATCARTLTHGKGRRREVQEQACAQAQASTSGRTIEEQIERLSTRRGRLILVLELYAGCGKHGSTISSGMVRQWQSLLEDGPSVPEFVHVTIDMMAACAACKNHVSCCMLAWTVEHTDALLRKFPDALVVLLASPPCTAFSYARTTDLTEQDLEQADELVMCVRFVWDRIPAERRVALVLENPSDRLFNNSGVGERIQDSAVEQDNGARGRQVLQDWVNESKWRVSCSSAMKSTTACTTAHWVPSQQSSCRPWICTRGA
ncbi:hypothetical protein FOA52_006806 [Chlamydomonas sp. UWO 241]|nr:hypothetical protein FOA52_006806 [Chlamydomonas sp. UWO 241]